MLEAFFKYHIFLLIMDDTLEVDMVDLTCRTLPYDMHLVEGLRNIDVEVDLWAAGCLPEQQGEGERQSILDVAGKSLRGPFRKIAKGAEYLINGVGLHWSLHKDIVHYQWLPFAEKMPSLEMINLKRAKKNSAGVVYTVHNVLPHDTRDRYRNAFQQLYQLPDTLICHTESSKNQLVEDFSVPTERVWVIPHGPLSHEVTFIPREEARSRLQLDSETPMCLLFGFIRPYKGIEFLIDSWRYVKDQEQSAGLMLAGQPEKGYGEKLTSKIKKLDLTQEIETCFEFLPQEKLNLYIQAADVLVYPYRSITQSGALLTGLATGKPVVATNVGGFSEMIQHEQTGILIEYGDEEQLATELVDLFRDSEKREKLGQAAKEMVETEYSWEAIAGKTLECYQSVVNSRQQ
jgi:glycosyltransferase involved in cell wall biosynthesis